MASVSKAVTMENINPNIVKLEYAVRGPIVVRALEIEREIKKGAQKPFKAVIKANIGDAHAMGQKPITFIRQVLACVSSPSLIENGPFPSDVKERAREILKSCGAGESVGAYSVSYGIERIRKSVAAYIEKRDGHPANWENVCLCNGASNGIKNCLQLFCNDIDGKQSGIMIPIPQYPLYSASLAEYNLAQVRYYLDEERGWALTEEELERSYNEGMKQYNVRALVVINPGNPTGQVLSRENIETIIKFAQRKKLFIFADEVYQHNVYAGSKFHSFKKVMVEMGKPYSDMELASFMSASKGYMGECGLRGGWMELCNFDPNVQANMYKAISAMLCPSTLGQTVIDCVAHEPQPGEPSYELFHKEKTQILQSLEQRAKMVADTFNKMEGFTCNVVQGAMYAFPQFKLSAKAIAAAEKAGQKPDFFYAYQLLEDTGICIIPGSGFGQKPGTWHFRTTILPQTKLLAQMLDSFQQFHAKFTKQYAD